MVSHTTAGHTCLNPAMACKPKLHRLRAHDDELEERCWQAYTQLTAEVLEYKV